MFRTAVDYQMFHTAALLSLVAMHPYLSLRVLNWIRRTWIIGVVLFSGSLYLLAITQKSWLGMITPVGGISLLAGWGTLIVGSIRNFSTAD